ncbi:uncharacterized protein YndB with AHSA1/START domain [Bacillus pakistanensis]|uniref:Uncharacterized protein YndB with AHSA1/START domain n=1 Tax=Rossellomorea pakistanensis TaxID=992288 RepID=A0ABS2NCG6_9BACI|nr:SRPBCC family protein [Bacillus pakistanensis]MBM7585505.1 uncharacterized protein YndB with AHSA1/START domain [Bacillus pakistanensis]
MEDLQVTTKVKLLKPTHEVFEAIVNPEEMAHYWFSSGSGRLEEGKTVTWRYEEYGAEVDIHVLELQKNKKIVYQWPAGEGTVVTITLKEVDHTSTIIEVVEKGWKENDEDLMNILLGQKEGWVYMLTCLKGYLEHNVSTLRASLVF